MQHRSERHVQIPAAQAFHGLQKVLWRDAESVVALERSERASKLTGDSRRTEVEPFQHQRHDIALVRQSGLYLAAQPIRGVVATLQRGGCEQDKEMRARSYVAEDDALEVATGDAVVIEEDIIAVLCQVLENSECPRDIGAAIADKNGFLDAFHNPGGCPSRGRTELNDTRMALFGAPLGRLGMRRHESRRGTPGACATSLLPQRVHGFHLRGAPGGHPGFKVSSGILGSARASE